MKKKKIDYLAISLLTVVFALLLAISFYFTKNKHGKFYVSFMVNDKEQIIEPYTDDNENYYMFLPSHYLSCDAKINLLDSISLVIDNEFLNSETIDIKDIQIEKEYKIFRKNNEFGKVIFMCSKNLPAMYLEASSGNIVPDLCSDKQLSVSGYMSLIQEDGSVEYSDRLESISGRGNSTWKSFKEGWSIKLDKESPLLGMRNSSNWVLFGNALEESFGLRNYIAYNLAKEIGLDTTSEIRFIDLYIDNQYRGTYQLVERIENNKTNLDIGDLDSLNNEANSVILNNNKLKHYVFDYDNDGVSDKAYSDFVSPNNISGGYILERNYGYKFEDKPNVVSTNHGEHYVVRYPDCLNKEENEYITGVLQDVEDALFDENNKNKEGKYLTELIDVGSFVKKYLVDEISKNEASGVTSSYFYKKQNDELLYAGPIWDYDKSFGQFEEWKNPKGLVLETPHFASTSLWYEKLCKNKDMDNKIKEYYVSFCRPYLNKLINEKIDEWSLMIEDSYDMNCIRWMQEIKSDKNMEYVSDKDTYFSSVNNSKQEIKDWLTKRIEYLDYVWLND